uniref:Complement C1s subcomponent-like n=1 Tax=Astyanax mexicanus TaxID=7994 RepID=A0A8B9RKJ2_ASTMX
MVSGIFRLQATRPPAVQTEGRTACWSVCVILLPVCFTHPLAGWVSSPGHPGGYEPDIKMNWERCAPAGHTLTLSIVHLDLEDSHDCENDALEVFANGILISKLCGKKSTEQLQASVNPSLRSPSGGCLSLTFQTDYSNTEQHTGFRAFYTVQDIDECLDGDLQCSHFCHNYIGGYSCSCRPGYFLREDQHTCTVNCTEERFGEGVLTPPGSPGPYFENAQCTYTLSVEEGKQIILNFIGEFDVEDREGQCIDSLTVKTDSATFGPFCGKKAPSGFNTAARQVQVLFNTDQEGQNLGFSLTYRAKLMECPGTVTPDSVLSPQRTVYVVGDTVTVQCKTGYAFDAHLDNADVKHFESTCQTSGKWSPVYSCAPVDCGDPDLPDLLALTEEHPLTTYTHNISLKCSQFYQLSGHAHFTCNASGHWESNGEGLFNKANSPKCLPECGMNEEFFPRGRVFGGERAKLKQIPWQLLMKEPKRGGASLISDRWALTAAHFVDGHETKKMKFYGGMIDGKDRNAVIMETEKIIIHPDYERDVSGRKRSTFDNDIALVKMSARVPLSLKIRPVCLPEKSAGPVMKGGTGTVSGYGMTEIKTASRFLQYAHLQEYSEFPCFQSPMKVTDNMFCAGGEMVDSCKGDGGGPLVLPMLGTGSPNKPYRLEGIVSWGPPRCGNKDFKGYYTKVQNYLDWIRETMQKN